MEKNNFSMIKNTKSIPFSNGYSIVANMPLPEWFLKFKRNAFDFYLKNYDSINSDVKKFILENKFLSVCVDKFPSFEMFLKYPMLDVEAYTIVIVNGRYCSELSTEEELPFSLFSDGISNSVSDEPDFLDGKLRCADNALVALNSAYLSNGVVLDVAKNEKIKKPIHIISVTCCDDEVVFVNPRIFINIGENSSVDIIESNLSFDEKYFENRVCQFNVGNGAVVNHYKYMNVSKNSLVTENNFVDVMDNAKFNHISFVKNVGILNSFSRFDIASNCDVNSVSSVDANVYEKADITADIKHNANGSLSNVSLFATASDEADVKFKTLVECANRISGVDTTQISRIILNSTGASGRIKPFQNIWSEKVKAFHGAVVSGVNPKDLFFLESRGINTEDAKNLILKSCLANILQNIHNEKIYNAFYNLIWL
ncbi:MAG: SufD family Fe-S cluster assembly protein [Alphaproteobacteria bacterium]|nr:SufD family Fe-S cluster assembly protein [Alphaproteobacteria bacterium]